MTDPETDALWAEFHTVVNMTSRELRDWLRTCSAGEDAERVPDESGSQTGQRVLDILNKRKQDLTDDDRRVMRRVIDAVRAERRDDLEATAGQAPWRQRLMTIGHDPLKPPGASP